MDKKSLVSVIYPTPPARGLGATRMVVHRTRVTLQVIAPNGSEVLVTAYCEKAIAEQLKYTGNKGAAAAVGKAVAEQRLERHQRYPLTVRVPISWSCPGTGRCCP